MYIDAHSHWADPRILRSEIPRLLKKSLDKNISVYLQGGINPLDWQKQIELKNTYPNRFLLSFGLHPYFIAENDIEVCESAMDQLAQMTGQCVGLGETGLDFRDKYILGNEESQREKQITFFENHIALSKMIKKPLILHIVQAHAEAMNILKTWDPPDSGGFVHAFNGSFETAAEYMKMNFLISVGGAVTHVKNSKLRQAVKEIPLEQLLLESDSPDQPPAEWNGLNDSSSLWQIANEIATIKEINPQDVLETTTSNFKRLFKL
jgi:TatD DNase family protein